MRLTHAVECPHVRSVRLPLPGGEVDPTYGVPQGLPPAGRLAELLSELAEEVLAGQVATGASDLVAEHAGVGEVLEQGDDVSEYLVKREDIRVHRLVEPRV